MREKEQAEILTKMEEWADKKLDEKFQTEKFKALGKEHDHVFQALAFLGEASEKLSIAYTILKRDAEVMTDETIGEELSHLQRRLHEFKEYVRTGW